jgi:hypothetical protein
MNFSLTRREILLRENNIVKSENLITKSEWKNFSYECNFSEDFIREFKNEVHWRTISFHRNLSEHIIREFKDLVYWPYISSNQILSPVFIREFEHLLDWNLYFYHQEAPFEIMKTFIHKTSFYEIEHFSSKHLNELERKEIKRILKFKYLFEK